MDTDKKEAKPTVPYSSRLNPYFPHQVLMESTSACQLRCKMCAREDALERGTLEVGHMRDELAEKIMQEIARVNPKTRLWFCYFGEPTISKKLSSRIKRGKELGIETTIINSNGNLLIPKICDPLIESGLDEIYVGLDAATAETYAQVRIRGDYEQVVKNIHYLLKHKKDNLRVIVQYGVYEENEHELEAFKSYWSNYDVEIFIRPKMTWIGEIDEHYHTDEKRYPCGWQFDSFPIYFNGLVPYCICDWDNRLPQGDINKQSIQEVWQTSYRKWQNLHLTGNFDKLPDFCRQCRDWQVKDMKGSMKDVFDKRLSFEDIEVEKPPFVHSEDLF